MTRHFAASCASRAACVALTLALLPCGASAQTLERLSLRLEGGATGLLGAPQTSLYDTGGGGSARLDARLVGPFGVHLVGSAHYWPSENGTRAPASSTLYGVGAQIAPELGSTLALLVELEGGLSVSGANQRVLPFAGAGVGVLFPAASFADLGPVFRAGMIFPGGDESQSNRGTGAAVYWDLGLTISLHLPITSAPAPMPVVEAQRAAPPAPVIAAVAPPVVVAVAAPPVVVPAPVVVAPVAAVEPAPVAAFALPTLTFAFESRRSALFAVASNQQSVAQVVGLLREHPEVQLVAVESHTAESHGHRLNQRLTTERAEAVREALVRAGIASERVVAVGYGDRCFDHGDARTTLVPARINGALAPGASFGCAAASSMIPEALRGAAPASSGGVSHEESGHHGHHRGHGAHRRHHSRHE